LRFSTTRSATISGVIGSQISDDYCHGVPPVIGLGDWMAGAPRRSRALVLPPFKTDLLSRDFSRRWVRYRQQCLRIHPIPKPTSLWFPAFRRRQTPSMLKSVGILPFTALRPADGVNNTLGII